MVTECLFEHHVEVGQSVEFVHGRRVCRHTEEFFAQPALDVWALSELVETPRRRGACRLMTGNDEPANKK